MTAEELIKASDGVITHSKASLSFNHFIPHPGKYAERHMDVETRPYMTVH